MDTTDRTTAPSATDRRGFLRTAGGAAVAVAAGGLGGFGSLALGGSPAGAAVNGHGLTIKAHEVFGGRMHYYRFATNQIGWQPAVNVLLPDDYDATNWRRYPVMYLLHGGMGDFRSFDMNDDIRGLTAGKRLIVVMPDVLSIFTSSPNVLYGT